MVIIQHNKRGFILVELSIVLVIIGLLIGGILVGQSMISTSKIVAVAAQIQQFDAGVMNFKTKYNYLPGDAPGFGGNGDGLIDGQNQYVGLFSCESANFWGSMMAESYKTSPSCPITVGVPAYNSGTSKNVPKVALGGNDSIFYATAITAGVSTYADSANIKNYYAIVPARSLQTIMVWGRYGLSDVDIAVNSSELLALDKKIDDGVANAGNVLSSRIMGTANIAFDLVYPQPLGSCSIGASYTLASTVYACTPLIRIGAQAGDPQ